MWCCCVGRVHACGVRHVCSSQCVSCRRVGSVGSMLVVCAALAVRHVRAVLLAC